MRLARPALAVFTWCALALAACGPATAASPDEPRGATNGRMFDLVSSKPDGSEWTLRLRGDSLWVAYSGQDGKDAKDLGPYTLSAKEARKVWDLIDAADLYELDEGEPDPEVGSVMLRLRDPTEDGDHETTTTHVPRDTDDEAVLDLADYLITLVERHAKVEPAF